MKHNVVSRSVFEQKGHGMPCPYKGWRGAKRADGVGHRRAAGSNKPERVFIDFKPCYRQLTDYICHKGDMMAKKKDEKKDIRNFGIALTVILAVIGGISFYKRFVDLKEPFDFLQLYFILWSIAGVVLFCSLFVKPVMRPVFLAFMWLGLKMNWVMTRVILTIFFIIVLTPFGIFMRITRKDLLGRKYDPEAKSFWQEPKRDDYKPEYSERLY